MVTKKKREAKRKTIKNTSKISNKSNIDILRQYLYTLTNVSQPCNLKNCIIPKSKSGQQIMICNNNVYKAPAEQFVNRIEQANNNTIKMDNYSMNILIQSVIKLLPIKDSVEHYTKICKINNKYTLRSKKMGYKIKSKKYRTLQDYLLSIPEIDINLVCKWLEQICKTLDILYKKIQLHHCDTKAEQIFLSHTGKAILGDLDKVTFTLLINNKPERIRLTRLASASYFNPLEYIAALPDKLHLLSKLESMRFENDPRIGPDLEKAGFICSVALLSKTQHNAQEIVKKTKHLYKNYKIKLPENILTVKRPSSQTAAVYYVKEIKTPQYAKKLHSVVNLTEKNGKLKLTI